MYHRTGLDGWGIHAAYGGEISSPLWFATPTALPRPSFTKHCYIIDTFLSPSHSRNNTKQIQSSWRRRQRVPPEHQNKLFYQKQRKNSPWSWLLLCIRLLPVSNINNETVYPDFGVSVVFYWISIKIPGFSLISSWPRPDTFLPKRHISKLMQYLFRAIY